MGVIKGALKNSKQLYPRDFILRQVRAIARYCSSKVQCVGVIFTQPDSHYIRYTAASVLRRTTLSTPEGHWLTCAW